MAEFNLIENMYVKKSLAGVEDLTRGFGQEEQIRAQSNVKIKQINASHFQGALVFDTYAELLATNVAYMGDKTCAIVKETGQIYFRYGTNWGTAQNIAFQVKTIDDLNIVPPEVGICAVSDPIRGGIFSYVKANAQINNGGTIFDGWTRNYDNEVNVKWFGATGNGVTDDTDAIQKALDFSQSVVLPDGLYKITKGLKLQPNASLKGGTNSTIVSEVEGDMLTISVGCLVEGIVFKGLAELANQNGVVLSGGSGVSAITRCRVVGCKFQSIGGAGVKVANIETLQSNEILACAFSSCGVGVFLGTQANNTILSNCMITACSTGIKHYGSPAIISDNTLINNTIAMHFLTGGLLNAKTTINHCLLSSSKSKAIKFEGISNRGYIFENCVISEEVDFGETNNMVFRGCNLIGASLVFNNSNDNKFYECLSDDLRVSNDVGGTATCNYHVSPVITALTNDFSDGGWVEATRVTSDFLIAQNAVTYLQFNQFTQGMCFHNGFTKFNFYNQATGIFDFTQTKNPKALDHVFADIRLTFSKNDTTTRENMTLFLYRLVDSNDSLTELDTQRMFFFTHWLGWENNFMQTGFNGRIPRGLYKVVVRLGGISDFKLVMNKTPLLSQKGRVTQSARFWGI